MRGRNQSWVLFSLGISLLGCDEPEGLQQVIGELVFPETVDFGRVQVGMTARKQVVFENTGSAFLTIERFSGRQLEEVRYRFDVPNEAVTLPPGSQVEVPFDFTPFETADEPFQVEIEMSMVGRDPASLTLRGQSVANGLVIEPNPMDFGAVLIGAQRVMELSMTNTLSVPVTLRTPHHRSGRAEPQPSSGTSRFQIDLAANPSGILADGMELEPGSTLTVPVTYVPDPTQLLTRDRARWAVGNCASDLCELTVNMLGEGTQSALKCAPDVVDFEIVPPGRTQVLPVTCTNVTADDIQVSEWALGPQTASEYALVTPPTAQSLAGGESLQIEVAFSPTETTWETGAIVGGNVLVSSTTPRGGRLDPSVVQLTGRAGGAAMLVTPERLRFERVVMGTYNEKRFLVVNEGRAPLVVSAVTDDRDATGAFFTDANPAGFMLPVGTSTVVTVRFLPLEDGPITSAVRFESNDVVRPQYDLPVEGVGVNLPPCEFQIVPPRLNFGAILFNETETLSFRIENVGSDSCLLNDLDLDSTTQGSTSAFSLVNGALTDIKFAPGQGMNVTVEYQPQQASGDRDTVNFYISSSENPLQSVSLYGVGQPLLEIQCPPPVTTIVGVPVILTAQGQSIGSNIAQYAWAVTQAPNGGIGTPNQWQPSPPTAMTETFLPFIVGVYDIQITVINDQGDMAGCTTQVVAEGSGLQVTMTWDGAGDVDLHLHDGDVQVPWFSNVNDCYFANRTPIWDARFPFATGPNPELDFDNTVALGPENTRIQTPVIGQTYYVAAHEFARSAGRITTIDIFCGGSAPQATFVSRPLNAGDFWKVASVTFTSTAGCTVNPIDTYVFDSDAQTMF